MRWYKRMRSRIPHVSSRVIGWFVVGMCCSLVVSQANESNVTETTSTDAVLETYITRASKKGSFDYKTDVYVDVRFSAGNGSESILEYISEKYKIYSKALNITQVPSKNKITVLVGKDVLKEAKAGKIAGFGSRTINENNDYCHVKAVNENNSDNHYLAASILIDPSMGGDTRKCFLESFVAVFGFDYSLTLFVNLNPLYSKAFSRKSIDDAQIRAFKIREKCQPSLETPDFEICVSRELQNVR